MNDGAPLRTSIIYVRTLYMHRPCIILIVYFLLPKYPCRMYKSSRAATSDIPHSSLLIPHSNKVGRSALRTHFSERGEFALRKHRLLISRLLAAAALLLTALIHASPFLPAFGRVFLLIPAIVCLAMFEDVIPSLLFALVFGATWDASSAGRDGVYTLLCGVIAVAVSLSVRYYLRRKTATALLLTGAALAPTLAVFCLNADGAGSDVLLNALRIALPGAIAALALAPLYYLIYKKIYASAGASVAVKTFQLKKRKQ